MRSYMVYECKKCGRQSKSYNDIAKCEAEHIGLTMEERNEYIDLKEKVKMHSHIVNRSNNDETRANLDKVTEELIEFEEKHNLH